MTDEITSYENEADRARSRIASTVDDIQDRLSPRRVIGEAASDLQERGSALLDSGARLAREHPVALSLIGLSLGLLLLKRDSAAPAKARDAYDDVYGEDSYDAEDDDAEPGAVRRGVDKAREAAAAARDLAADKLAAARDKSADYAGRARDGLSDARRKASDTLDANPLAGALVGVAAGALVGALLPRTSNEDALLGETRDGLLDRARSAAKAGFDAGKAELDAAGINADAAKAKLSELGEQVKTIARNAGAVAADRLKANDATAGTA